MRSRAIHKRLDGQELFGFFKKRISWTLHLLSGPLVLLISCEKSRSRSTWLAGISALVISSTLVGGAQVGGKPATGNPTPGTAQPEPPNLNDRITLTGCLRPAPKNATAATEAQDNNTPTDTRFVLIDAERSSKVPPDTGSSAVAAAASGRTYRLEGLDSQFSPFVNAKVEISGEIRPPASQSAGTNNTPILLVEFVRRISPLCGS